MEVNFWFAPRAHECLLLPAKSEADGASVGVVCICAGNNGHACDRGVFRPAGKKERQTTASQSCATDFRRGGAYLRGEGAGSWLVDPRQNILLRNYADMPFANQNLPSGVSPLAFVLSSPHVT